MRDARVGQPQNKTLVNRKCELAATPEKTLSHKAASTGSANPQTANANGAAMGGASNP